MLHIEGDRVVSSDAFGVAILRLGFRPFFLLAGAFAVVVMALWMAVFVFAWSLPVSIYPPVTWHAHEMLFGYLMAVVAGFLLTAIRNWTSITVLRGKALAALVLCWLLARVLPFAGDSRDWAMAFDVGFLVLLTLVCLRPLWLARQYRQFGIVAKLVLLVCSDVAFHLGVAGVLTDGVHRGLLSALYILVGLAFVMMRRVMPMFIQNGIDAPVRPRNHRWLDVGSLLLLVALWWLDVFAGKQQLASLVALALAGLHGLRLAGWYHPAVWRKPLVWVLVAAYGFFILGFLLRAVAFIVTVPPSLAWHAHAVGGLGLLTLGMMSRVTLGHTGRNVFEPPAVAGRLFLLLSLAALIRVLPPLVWPGAYSMWIALSQGLWMSAFAGFVFVFAPMLWRARIDGRDG